MKKELFLVLAGLAMFSFLSCISTPNAAYLAGQRAVADVADMPAVADVPSVPRRNPLTQRAEGDTYALPAVALKPEAERLPPPVYAISGVKGQELNENNPWWEVVDVVIILPEKESFSRGILEGYEVTSWFGNLPKGLEALAHNVKKGATQIKIYVHGTPEETWRDTVKVNIPGTYLAGGRDRTFISPTEEASFEAWENQQTAGSVQ